MIILIRRRLAVSRYFRYNRWNLWAIFLSSNSSSLGIRYVLELDLLGRSVAKPTADPIRT